MLLTEGLFKPQINRMIGTAGSANLIETKKEGGGLDHVNTPDFVYCLGVERIHNGKLSLRGLAFVVCRLLDVDTRIMNCRAKSLLQMIRLAPFTVITC